MLRERERGRRGGCEGGGGGVCVGVGGVEGEEEGGDLRGDAVLAGGGDDEGD